MANYDCLNQVTEESSFLSLLQSNPASLPKGNDTTSDRNSSYDTSYAQSDLAQQLNSSNQVLIRSNCLCVCNKQNE